MTYLYWFTKYAWSDKIWQGQHKFKDGDLLTFWGEYFLSLWKEVSFFEQYKYFLPAEESEFELVEKKLLNKQTLEFLHWMVYWRYAPYYNVVPKLFLPTEIENLIDKKPSSKPKKTILKDNIFSFLDQKITLSTDGQNLIVFPDLWTISNMLDDEFLSQTWVELHLSSDSQSKKNKLRRAVSTWETQVILCTHAEIFQNYKNLTKVVIIRPHKRYYANSQDPRYKTLEVVQKLSEIRSCPLEIIEI